jgi:septum formation protein
MITAVRLVLASASPRRAELLAAAGIRFEALAVDIDEAVRPGEEPTTYVRRLALEKSSRAQTILAASVVDRVGPVRWIEQVGRMRDGGPTGQDVVTERVGPIGQPAVPAGKQSGAEDLIVLGADTAVVVDGEILGKPRDPADAERMLRLVSGRRHDVITGVSLRRNEIELGGVETTAVDFVALDGADVAWYCASGEGQDKAGGYAIQGLASRFVTRIEGSYSNVVGLPVAVVFGLLRRLASAG